MARVQKRLYGTEIPKNTLTSRVARFAITVHRDSKGIGHTLCTGCKQTLGAI